MARKLKAVVLTEQIRALYQELEAHQEKCRHPAKRRTYRLRGNVGNYDPSQDHYWTEYTCSLCLKWWSVDDQRNLVGRWIKDD